MPLSPPVTIRTSFFATSTMATALSTAECTRSNSPAARPSRCRVEFSVKESCRARSRLAKTPFATPACMGRALAFGKLLTRTVAGSAVAAVAAATVAQTRIHRWIICLPPAERATRFSHTVVACGFVGICELSSCLRREAETRSAGSKREFRHARNRKSQSFLATRVHELPEDQGVPYEERGRLRVDQCAR